MIYSSDKTAKLCDALSFETNATLNHDDEVACAAVDERKVITACGDVGLINVFRNAPPYPFDFMLKTDVDVFPISIINDDVILVARQTYVTFVSMASKSILVRIKFPKYTLYFSVILADGRIAVGGGGLTAGYSATFKPPDIVWGLVEYYISRVY